MPGFNFGNHGLEAGTIEICSAVSIVRKMLDVVKAVFASVIFQILFLIQNAVRSTFSSSVILTLLLFFLCVHKPPAGFGI